MACSDGQACNYDVEAGGYCYCSAGTWICTHGRSDMAMSDLAASD